jgi:hypothetical protein
MTLKFLAMISLFVATPAFAAELVSDPFSFGSEVPVEESLFYEDDAFMNEDSIEQASNCYAYTDCVDYWGNYRGTISCTSYGSGCTFRVFRNSHVSCTGFNSWGNWATWTVSCR